MYGDISIKCTVRKWLAIHRDQEDFDYWIITHIPSGLPLPGFFFSKGTAIEAAKLARRVFPHPLNINKSITKNRWFALLEEQMIKFVK